MSALAARLQWSHRLVMGSYAFLLLTMALATRWQVSGAVQLQHAYSLVVIWGIKAVPMLLLLAFLPGLRRRNYRTCVWLCFLLLFYFADMVATLAQSPGSVPDWLRVLACTALFTACLFFVRWQRQALHEAGLLQASTGPE